MSPVIIPSDLPASEALKKQNIFVMNDTRAQSQDIRPLRICILNLMPDKITTETQLLSKLSNSIIQIEITLLKIESHHSKNTTAEHLTSFYQNFSDVKTLKYDALIVTGAPIEHLKFEEVNYYSELKEILDWSKTNIFTSLFICWGAQFALNYFYDIPKEPLKTKLSGIFPSIIQDPNNQLFMGMPNTFYVPHSRHTQSNQILIENNPHLKILATSKESGHHLVTNLDNSRLFMSGHPEYNLNTLDLEYHRDIINDKNTLKPNNYYLENGFNDKWVSDSSLFYLNWLNYYVYQATEYDL